MPTRTGDEGGHVQRDTIVALSSAPGKGAIAIVRLSGARAAEIAGKIFYPNNAAAPPENHKKEQGKR